MNAIYTNIVSMHAINIALASFIYTRSFIHGLQLRKPRERVKSDLLAVLVRESNMQLLKYSLDIRVSYSTCLPIFKSQKGSIEALNFLIITSLITS